jgi:nicotinamide-nucleotide amidase
VTAEPHSAVRSRPRRRGPRRPDRRGPDPRRRSELVGQVHRLLAGGGATVAVAESLTGGMLGAALTDMPGSSATFAGGVVAYATELKHQLLGVPEDLLAAHGAVHPDVARAMAAGVCRLLGASYGLGVTGVAGPEPQDGMPVGTVYVAVAAAAGPGAVEALRLPAEGGRSPRAQIRRLTVVHALDLLRRRLRADAGRAPLTAGRRRP